MSLVLRENEWALAAIEKKELGKSPYETFRRVARYYLDSGMSKSSSRKAVEDFLLSCVPSASVVKWSRTIDAAMSYASKHPAVEITSVSVSESELKTIDAIQSGRQSQRLAFTLLCLAKYWHIRNGCEGDSYWVNNSDSEIMQMANIKTTIRRQCKLYHDLCEAGLISFSHKIDCNNVKVNFVVDATAKLVIDNFTNLGNQYLMYAGEPYFKCAECGVVTKFDPHVSGRKQKYCSECAAKVVNAQKRAYAIKTRDADFVEKNRIV